MTSASDLTIDHYQRPEVEETILRCSQDGGAWRCLNGDQGWYITAENGGVRLRRPEDYDKTTGKFRTLYWSLDLFEPEVQNISDQWDEVRKRPVHPIGTLRECRAYSLGVDIDAVGHNAFDDPDITKALEEAATFLIDRLREAGVKKSVYALCSGGGIYVLIHHALFTAKSEWSGGAREVRFRHLLEMYNAFIRDTAEAFFEAHPEHVGRVVFDALNGQKRKFKTIFSIHKTVPAAVVPLDPQCIKISKEDATIPLSSEVLEQGAAWYRDFDPSDKDRLQELLRPYAKAAEEKLERRKTDTGSYDLFRRDAPTLPDEWCPLMQKIAGGVTAGEIGRHAALGNLARHLYADGWSMEAAFRLWSSLADQAGVEYRIFDTSFGEISEARCEAINEPRAGYPASSLGGTRFAESCATCPRREAGGFPSDYAHPKAKKATTSTEKDDGIKSITEEELNGLPVAENPRLSINLEPDNFISEYVDYASSQSDAYTEYHYAGALFMASTATDRRVVLKLKQGTVHPNLWLFCLGNSTTSRKTTAMNGPGAILDTYEVGRRLPSSFSPEALIEALADCPRSFFMKDEAGSLLAAMGKKYMDEARDFFSELYEGKDYHRKLRTGQRKEKRDFPIKSPYVTQWLATTPDNFRAYTSELDVTSGWLLRYAYFWPDHVKPWKAFEEATEEDFSRYATISMKYRDLKEKLAGLELEGLKLSLTAEGWEHFASWQQAIEERAMREEDRILQAVAGRLMTFALKLAMVFTVGRSDFDPATTREVSLSHVQEATRQVESYFLPTARVVIEEVARSERENLQNQIIGTIRRAGGKIARRDLLRKLHVKLDDVDKAISALEASEEIETLKVEGKGPTRYVYRLTVSNVPIVSSVPSVSTVSRIHDYSTRAVKPDRDKSGALGETDGTVGTVATEETGETPNPDEVTGESERSDPKEADPPDEEETRSPTAEEAGALEDVARRILQNWPGIAEARLWELAREKLGSPLPLAVVKAWLKESGYTEAGRLNGSPLWNPPVGAVG